MTAKQRIEIQKDIEKAISNIAKKNGVYKDEVESIVIDFYVDEDDFMIIPWPEIQAYMDIEGFDINSSLANDETTLNKYGDQAYFVNKQWLNAISEV